MINIKTKEELVRFLLNRFQENGPEFQFNVALNNSPEYRDMEADLLFSTCLEKAKFNAFLLYDLRIGRYDKLLDSIFINNISESIFTMLLAEYAKMFRGSSNVKRLEITLLQTARINKKGERIEIDTKRYNERFHIEEFFEETDLEYTTHQSIMHKFDKYIAHVDKTNHFHAFPVIILSNRENPGFIGLDNYWEKLGASDVNELKAYIHLINTIDQILQERITLKFQKEDRKIQNSESLDPYYQNIWIDQEEIAEYRKTGKLKNYTFE